MSRSFSIGPTVVSPALVLAPMSGVTDMAFRRLVRECSPGAVGLVVSEFISIEGLTRRDLKSHRMMRYHPGEHPIGIQIFGADIDRMAEAAAIVQETGVDHVDVNCGCPVPKVVKRGGGAELLRRPAHLERMLRAVRRELSVPLTLKIRIGWDDDSINGVEIAQMAEAAGVALITVHGRTRVQLYAGAADWERIADVKRAVGVPVVGSGDVVSVATARARWQRGGVDGLAIGRGAMENPWIFAQLAADLEGREVAAPTVRDRLRALRRYRELLDEVYPEKVTAARLRGMACRVAKGFPGSAALREAVTHTRTTAELLAVLGAFESRLTAESRHATGAPVAERQRPAA
ncbi:MAG TPA: tRNA dihydrouridine synthase DusB [Candidatus Binatia bacterium]|nr:tRNA dihydrouridine synthase DusB [Candidatus Binatia bacterium]